MCAVEQSQSLVYQKEMVVQPGQLTRPAELELGDVNSLSFHCQEREVFAAPLSQPDAVGSLSFRLRFSYGQVLMLAYTVRT